MLFLSRPLLAWMARKRPIHEGEAEVLDRYMATGQLPTDARILAPPSMPMAFFSASPSRKSELWRGGKKGRRGEREAMFQRVQEDAEAQDRVAEERDRLRHQAMAAPQVRFLLFLLTWKVSPQDSR